MAFWSMTSSLSMAGATEKVLDRESFTLKELLDSDDILNQVLAPNDRVIRYLCQPDVVEELVELAIASPPSRTPAKAAINSQDDGQALPLHDESDTVASQQTNDSTNSDTSGKPKSDGEIESQDDVKEKAPQSQKDGDKGKHRSFYSDEESYEYREFQEDSGCTDFDVESDEEFEEERLRQIRYSKVSAEILTTDVWMLLDALLSNDTAMRRLWSVLDGNIEASSQQLGLLTKIVEGLLEKRLDRMLDFIRTLPNFVDYFIRYIECQLLVDFLIKVISTDHPESPTDIIDFLYGQDLIPKMIELLDVDVPHSAQSAAGDFLKAFVNISGGNKSDICAIGPNELSRQFVGYRCMNRLIEIMLKGGHGMCVAVTVIIETIRKNNSDYDVVEVTETTLDSHPPDPRDNIYLGTMVKLFAKAIPKFQEMLVAPETRTMKMPFGEIRPLGFERFRICELYAELLHCSNMNLLNDPNGERIIQERDAERINVFFPDRELPNKLPEHMEDKTKKQDDNDSSYSNKNNNTSEDPTTIDAVDPSAQEEHGEELLSDSDADDSNSPFGASDVTQSAHAPESFTPSSPAQIIDSPPMTPSPPTPENESEEELDYIDDNRQKVTVSNFRGKQLEEFLAKENRKLRLRAVVGDQLKFALDDNHCIDAVLKMLFDFPWNNFLHNVVFDIVQQVFNGYIDHSYNKFLAIHLFTRAHLTEQIVRGQQANENHEREKKIRLGYVGHLTLISEEVVKFGSLFVPESLSPEIAEALNDREWNDYVQNDLLQLREQYNTVLGKASLISEEEDSYDIQEDDDRRVLALELKLNEDNASRIRQQTREIDQETDSDSDSDTESESDSDGEELTTQIHAGNSDEDEDDAEEIVGDSNDYDDFPRLSPQNHRSNSDEEKAVKTDNTTVSKSGKNNDKFDHSLFENETLSNRDKIPKNESEFARYMSSQLNTNQFSSGSSDEDEEDEDEQGRLQNSDADGWIPVGANKKSSGKK